MGEYYILKGKKAVACNCTEWAQCFRNANRKVAKDTIGDSVISTVFLGLDHSFGYGPPLLFETLVFGGKLDQEMDRYTTLEEAEKGHLAMVEKVKTLNK